MGHSIFVAENPEAMSREAAARILAAIDAKPNLLLCAAGGTTPLHSYELLARHYANRPEIFDELRVIKLDEWGGLAPDDPGTCERQMQSYLVGPLGIAPNRYLGFHAGAAKPERDCERVHRRLEAEGPIDVCVLGLGANGHLAMNEPAAALQPFAHVAQLAHSSLRHPMLASSRNAPTYGLTLGMVDILLSRQILLLVTGGSKRQPLARLLEREITPQFPASFLWLHPNWTLLCDRAAAEGLPT